MNNISIYRRLRGWSKSELARQAQMAPGDVGKIESGRLLPYPSQLQKLAEALGVSTGDLITEAPVHDQ